MKTPFLLKTSLFAVTGGCILPQLVLAQVTQKPHIILIISDQHRGDAINCMGVTDKKYKRQLEELRQAMVGHLSERGEKFVKDGRLQVLKQTILYSPLFPDKNPTDTGI